MANINFSPNPGHVVIGIERRQEGPLAGRVVVYAYHNVIGGNRIMSDFPYDPAAGHVLALVEQVADAAEAAGAEAVSASSSVDFWEEAIA